MKPAGEGSTILVSDLGSVNNISRLWRFQQLPSLRHLETCRRVAAATVFEREVAAKGTLAIMTGQASLPTRSSEMLKGKRRTDLARLGRARRQRVTIGAG